MNEEQMIAAFEAWFTAYSIPIDPTGLAKDKDGEYLYGPALYAWEGWKAAIASQAKSVPEMVFISDMHFSGDVHTGYRDGNVFIMDDGDEYTQEQLETEFECEWFYAAPQPADDRLLELERPSKRVLDVIYYCMSNFRDFEEKDWRDHGFTGATFKKAEQFMQKISKL